VGNAADFVRKRVSGLSEGLTYSTRDEIKHLTEKVDKLTENVALLVQKMEEGAKSAKKATSF
jgi:hypothetical protein